MAHSGHLGKHTERVRVIGVPLDKCAERFMISEGREMSPWAIAVAYPISILGGGLLAKYWVVHLKKCIDKEYNPRVARSPDLDWSIGVIERGITTTLVIWAPSLAPVFVGGWVTLKFAANWDKRVSGEEFEAQQKMARQRLTGLIGSAISLTVAIGAGVLAHPHSLRTWSN